MISVYKIKPAFQKALMPILKSLHRIGVTANQLTVLAVFFSIGLGVLLWYHVEHPYFLLIVAFGLLVRMALNALDGMMARQYKMQSRLGEVLNEIGDVISDVVILLPLAVIPVANPYLIVLITLLAVLNEYAGILGKAMGGDRRYEGPMGKSDRALVIGLICLTGYFWQGLFAYTNWIIGICCLLILVSTYIRLKKAIA